MCLDIFIVELSFDLVSHKIQYRKVTSKMRVLVFLLCLVIVRADYWRDRKKFVDLEEQQAIGSSINLDDKEAQANLILMRCKQSEYDAGMNDPKSFLPAEHFFLSREKIEDSDVFQIIRMLPKGAMLHGHFSTLASNDFIYNLTYEKYLYACKLSNGRIKLEFITGHLDKTCNWVLAADWRKKDPSFNDLVKSQLTLIRKNPWNTQNDANDIWQRFSDTYETISRLVSYDTAFNETSYRILQELYEDNIRYLEFRASFSKLNNGHGGHISTVQGVGYFLAHLEKFKKTHPDFIGARLIFSGNRQLGKTEAEKYLDTVKAIKAKYPDFIAGFDLSGREDTGKPLYSFQKLLGEIKSMGLKLFLHAGATSWYGTEVDANLIDAVLLNATRITHADAINKHPNVLKAIKEKNITIELCPIADQVLGIVEDQRNHPASTFIARGYRVVICNEDPALWGAKGVSYDWYITFMGLASRNMDLRFLKQLALNSFSYSSMSEKEKTKARAAWQRDWEAFLDNVINNYRSLLNK